jgi:hypothetical protein
VSSLLSLLLLVQEGRVKDEEENESLRVESLSLVCLKLRITLSSWSDPKLVPVCRGGCVAQFLWSGLVMGLYVIGLGLGDERDITVRGLELVKQCTGVYLEYYTSVLGADIQRLVRSSSCLVCLDLI